MKHLSVAHASTKLTLAKNSVADAVDDDSRPGVANVSSGNSLTTTELNALIDSYVVENLLPLSTVDYIYI